RSRSGTGAQGPRRRPGQRGSARRDGFANDLRIMARRGDECAWVACGYQRYSQIRGSPMHGMPAQCQAQFPTASMRGDPPVCRRTFTVNERTYTVPEAPVGVICIDGSEPDYHREAIKAGRMPWLAKMLETSGSSWAAHCAMPALTNPNNLSIATGHPPAVHGISGNYIFDTETGEEVLMNDKRFLRVPTIFGAANEAGLDVVVVTAKDKLRRL